MIDEQPVPSASLSAAPQFSKAEYANVSSAESCRICGQAIAGPYFRVNGAMACASCAH
jgi:hypothetical protein